MEAEEVKRGWAESTNVFSNWTYWWITPLLVYGYRHPIQEKQLPPLSKDMLAERIDTRFARFYEEELKKPAEDRSLVRVLIKMIGYWQFAKSFIIALLYIAAQFAAPAYFMKNIITLVGTPEPLRNYTAGGLWIAGFAVSLLLVSLFNHRMFYYTVTSGLQVRAAVMMAVYDKALRLSTVSSTVGEIVSMQANDAYRIHELYRFFHLPFALVVAIITALVLIAQEVGWYPALVGVTVLLALYFPTQIGIGKYVAVQRGRIAAFSDLRIRLMSEILTAVKLVKLYAWEQSFADQVNAIREREMRQIRRAAMARNQNNSVTIYVPIVATFLTFVTYHYLGGVLTAATVFTTSSLIDAARFLIDMMPSTLRGYSEGLVGLQRLQRFLNLPEVEDRRELRPDVHTGAVIMEGASFSWPAGSRIASATTEKKIKIDVPLDSPDASFAGRGATLVDIDLKVRPGELLAIVGPVGSGKTSLLSAIVGQIPLKEGRAQVDGTVAYATQQAWVMNATLKDNVLFGQAFDENRYSDALRACQLVPDLAQLPAGDETEIGERGINLSGGQKQRVSLARAVYANRDLYVLDDPLSAVDQHVGKKLVQECLCGVLKGKTRLLVTNQLHVLPHCDRVAVLQHGRIVALGTYADLVAKKVDFGVPLAKKKEKKDKDKKKKDKEEKKAGPISVKEAKAIDFASFRNKGKNAKIVVTEDREIGSVNASVYWAYMKAAGSILFTLLVLLFFILAQTARLFPDLWLSWWVRDQYGFTPNQYIVAYGVTCLGVILINIVRNVLYTHWTLSASRSLHNTIFFHVLRGTMRFFDSTPIGRILNRFSKDLDHQAIFYMLGTLCSLIFIAVFLPYFLIAVVPLAVLFAAIALFYRRTSRELKRIDSISRSPIFAHLSATLSGLPTIRGYDLSDEFLAENRRRVDTNLRASFYFEMAARWLALRLESFVGVLGAVTALIVVFTPIPSAISGLLLQYTMNLNIWFSWMVRVSVETENAFTSVERLVHYSSKLPTEAPFETEGTPSDPSSSSSPSTLPGTPPPAEWPQKGQIEFENVTAHYDPEGSPVLRSLSFRTGAAEKVGIVGRTGAGKSTLVTTIFRLLEISEGTIRIDGLDIAKVGLRDLRSKLGIIPQDPVLFTGTIRSNLDPFEQHSEEAIWETLDKVHLKDAVQSLPEKLSAVVLENGENFSVGQRQLLCIGRALLRGSKILVLDEATASIDLKTDHLIQATIRSSFARCTVLTIAHRLHTIIDSDRILVLDKGALAELDTPAALLSNRKSQFYRLVRDTGPDEARQLKKLAQERLHITLALEQAASPTASPRVSDGEEEEEKVANEEDEEKLEVKKKEKLVEKAKKKSKRNVDEGEEKEKEGKD